MSASSPDATTETVHCDTCNSDIEPRNFLKVTWAGEPGPACPNCNSLIGPALTPEPVDRSEIASFLERTGHYCTHCGSILPPANSDQANFCPHCGRPVSSQLASEPE